MKYRNILLLAVACALLALPWWLPPRDPAQPFANTDHQARAAILAAHPDYQPWFSPLWQPSDSAVESLLFALQAALGGGLFGYCIGYQRGRSRRRDSDGTD